MFDVLLDTAIDILKVIPFLFLTYLLMEYLEHKMSDKTKYIVQKAGKAGPLYGGILGAFPQCGFSAAASNLYCGRVITLGTLIAIYLSTSDEMLPILISEQFPISEILKILATKVIIGIIFGFLIDFLFRKFKYEENIEEKIGYICKNEDCHCDENGVLKSALKHSFNIIIFLFIISFTFNTIIEFIGEDNISNLVLNIPVIGPIIAGVIGLIPNCASSVIITQLYVKGITNLGTMISGLLVNAGVGLLVLFKENKNIKENIKIVAILYCSGVISGIIIETLMNII